MFFFSLSENIGKNSFLFHILKKEKLPKQVFVLKVLGDKSYVNAGCK